MIQLDDGIRQIESEIIVQERERYISQMGPLCSKGQSRTLNHYDSQWIVCDQCVSLCVCVFGASKHVSLTCAASRSRPPPDVELLHAHHRTHSHTQFQGPVGQLWGYYAAREVSDGSLKGRFVLCPTSPRHLIAPL